MSHRQPIYTSIIAYEKRISEMSEEEYENLEEKEKEKIDLIRLEKKRQIRDRRKKQQEELLREQESQEVCTENSKKKGKKGRETTVDGPVNNRRSGKSIVTSLII